MKKLSNLEIEIKEKIKNIIIKNYNKDQLNKEAKNIVDYILSKEKKYSVGNACSVCLCLLENGFSITKDIDLKNVKNNMRELVDIFFEIQFNQ